MEDRLDKEDANALTKKIVEKMYPGYAAVIDNSFEDCFLVLDLEPVGISKDELAVLIKSLIAIVKSVQNQIKKTKVIRPNSSIPRSASLKQMRRSLTSLGSDHSYN